VATNFLRSDDTFFLVFALKEYGNIRAQLSVRLITHVARLGLKRNWRPRHYADESRRAHPQSKKRDVQTVFRELKLSGEKFGFPDVIRPRGSRGRHSNRGKTASDIVRGSKTSTGRFRMRSAFFPVTSPLN
jgi:hypothetical protein